MKPSKKASLTAREEVWLRAWAAVANTENVTKKDVCTSWADGCLSDFDQRFPRSQIDRHNRGDST